MAATQAAWATESAADADRLADRLIDDILGLIETACDNALSATDFTQAHP